jgi:hypothetical protein
VQWLKSLDGRVVPHRSSFGCCQGTATSTASSLMRRRTPAWRHASTTWPNRSVWIAQPGCEAIQLNVCPIVLMQPGGNTSLLRFVAWINLRAKRKPWLTWLADYVILPYPARRFVRPLILRHEAVRRSAFNGRSSLCLSGTSPTSTGYVRGTYGVSASRWRWLWYLC